MLSVEDIQILSDLMDKKFDEKLKPINERLDRMDERLDKVEERLDKMDERLDQMQDDISELKEDMKFSKSMINTLSQWAEAATEYYMHGIHYPLHDDEIVR